MAKLVECALNFSEGQRADVIEEIVAAAKNVRVLDVAPDASHNRTVLTFVGQLREAGEAACAVTARAVRLIDMNGHRGEHPRMGAVDVIPFVPLQNTTMQEAVSLAQEVGRRIGTELRVPVFLYEAAATRPERRNLANIRRGEYEGLTEKLRDPEWVPDYGPGAPHPTAGATVVGARTYLVAFNVNLGTPDIGIAKQVARALRSRTGGLSNVKAIGVSLAERGIVQVSMNLVDPLRTPLHRVFELVRLEAERYGVPVVGSEVVGLLPLRVVADTARHYLRLEDFEDAQVLETRLWGEE